MKAIAGEALIQHGYTKKRQLVERFDDKDEGTRAPHHQQIDCGTFPRPTAAARKVIPPRLGEIFRQVQRGSDQIEQRLDRFQWFAL